MLDPEILFSKFVRTCVLCTNVFFLANLPQSLPLKFDVNTVTASFFLLSESCNNLGHHYIFEFAVNHL